MQTHAVPTDSLALFSGPSVAERFQELDRLLLEYAWLWRPQPYKQARPRWCETLPALTRELLALDDDSLQQLSDDPDGPLSLLQRHVPALAPLAELCRLPADHGRPTEPAGHLAWEIPGRKWSQVEAFAAAVGPVNHPLLEWCGGKGHLGRVLAATTGRPVTTLDHDAALCGDGERLARRARVEQAFRITDVLAADTAPLLTRHHGVALHACGELHRKFVQDGVAAGAPALDIAPCCYHRFLEDDYAPFTTSAGLRLSRDDLRLAVTETVTSLPREVRLRDLEMAWKLGFDQLSRQLRGRDEYHPVAPINKAWLKQDFRGFCEALAAREGLTISGSPDWSALEAAGWQRQRETMRLSLVRKVFRRPLEVWLVLDLAGYLQGRGYGVVVRTFCDRQLTPRNILISARR